VVVGVPDEDLGQRVHAIVDIADGTTEGELRTHLADRLIRYKTPRTYDFVEGPLRDDAGKVRKSALVADIVARAAADA
jgi:bile acid-coenzyme A ligase